MIAITLDDALARRHAAGGPWVELLRVPDLSCGLYVLAAGAVDPQQPHAEDEVYVILAGRGRFTAGDESRDVGPGDVLFVPARVPHRFHDIAEELRIVVVFGPAEGTRVASGP
jgi:mannose-6-phosphate isomerase-like protein (cupin superfamily)